MVYGRIVDEKGMADNPLFLTAPIKNGMVTSSYRKRRYHPILKRYTPHLGTDFGAPKGTPILAMADGTVSEVSKNRYNGRYVKIRHNRTYETQYLHMTRWTKDLRPGQKVRQGEVIGYVGNTGLAYGYHVCLRLWKNGKQVDFKKQRFPQSKEKTSAATLEKVRELKRALEQDGANL
jgi:murein DD-endopeptidase MepM/ murein hydrolase activator NlpD